MKPISPIDQEQPSVSLSSIIKSLFPLPDTIMYEDDYDEVVRKIDVASSKEKISIFVSGVRKSLNLMVFEGELRTIIQGFLLPSIGYLAPMPIKDYFHGLMKIPKELLSGIIIGEPLDIRMRWPSLTSGWPIDSILAAKSLLAFLCDAALGNWGVPYRKLVSHLPVPKRDPYSVIRSGECFLSVEEEAALVRWIDHAALSVEKLSIAEIRIASLVICAYQFGMRPKQLGVLRKRDYEARINTEDGHVSVYLDFRVLKQKDLEKARLPMRRKVKREWAALLVAAYACLEEESDSAFFFGFASRAALSRALKKQLDKIVPDRELDAYALRHSMAQRMVDGGASRDEVAAALGHSSLHAVLIYFRRSAEQARLVNESLAISPIYQTMIKIGKDRFISDSELAELKGIQQIAGVPHGIPIAGIGGCQTGQPSCPYNPITSCYGCNKFIPVIDITIH